MPDITREKLVDIMSNAPEGVSHDEIMSKLQMKGVTVGGKPLPVPKQQSMLGSAGQAALETAGQVVKHPLQTLSESPDIPLLGKAVGYARDKLPGQVAELSGKMGLPDKVGAGAGLAVEGVANLAPKNLGDVALLGLPKVAGAAGKMLAPLKNPAIDGFAHILGGISGRSPEFFKEILKDPDIMKFSKHVIGEFEGKRAMEAIKAGRNKIGAVVGDLQNTLIQKYGENKIVNIGKSLNKVLDIADRFRVRVPTEISGQPIKSNRVVEKGVEYEKIIEHLRQFKHIGEMSLDAAFAFKDKLKNEIGSTEFGEYSSNAKSVLKAMYGEVNEAISQGLPEMAHKIAWKNANKKYSIAVDLYDKLETTLGKESPHSIANALSNAVKSGYSESSYIRRAKFFGEQAEKAIMDIKKKAVASNFKDMFAKGGLHSDILPTSPALAGRIAQGASNTGGAFSALVDQIKILSKKNPTMAPVIIQALLGSGGPAQNQGQR